MHHNHPRQRLLRYFNVRRRKVTIVKKSLLNCYVRKALSHWIAAPNKLRTLVHSQFLKREMARGERDKVDMSLIIPTSRKSLRSKRIQGLDYPQAVSIPKEKKNPKSYNAKG
jgi:hypothetical protein